MKKTITLVCMMMAMLSYSYGQILNVFTKGTSFPIAAIEIDSIQCLPSSSDQIEELIDIKAILESSEEGWYYIAKSSSFYYPYDLNILSFKGGLCSCGSYNQEGTFCPKYDGKLYTSMNSNKFILLDNQGVIRDSFKILGMKQNQLTLLDLNSKEIINFYRYKQSLNDVFISLNSPLFEKHYFVDIAEDMISSESIKWSFVQMDSELNITFDQNCVSLFSRNGLFKDYDITGFKYNQETKKLYSESSNINCVYQWPLDLYSRYRLSTDSIVVSLSTPKVQEIMKILEDMVSESFPSQDKTLFTKIGFGASNESGSKRRDGICFSFRSGNNTYSMSVGSSYCNYCNSFVIESSKDEEGNYDYSSNFQNYFTKGMKEAIDNLIDLLQGEFIKSQDSENKHYTLTSKKDPTIYFTWYINRE